MLDCSAAFGVTDPALPGAAIPIYEVAGDHRRHCRSGVLRDGHAQGDLWDRVLCALNTGGTPVASNNRLLTTVAYQLGGERHYALEGSIFVAGASVQWRRDGMPS